MRVPGDALFRARTSVPAIQTGATLLTALMAPIMTACRRCCSRRTSAMYFLAACRVRCHDLHRFPVSDFEAGIVTRQRPRCLSKTGSAIDFSGIRVCPKVPRIAGKSIYTAKLAKLE